MRELEHMAVKDFQKIPQGVQQLPRQVKKRKHVEIFIVEKVNVTTGEDSELYNYIHGMFLILAFCSTDM